MQNKLIFLTLGFFLASQAMASNSASPSLNSNCRYVINTPPNGSGVLFDESCSIAYVLPPELGKAEIAALAETTNVQFCSAVKDVEFPGNVQEKKDFHIPDAINEHDELQLCII
jgi:hypothetical protein